MEKIVKIPKEIADVIPKFDGDEKLLNLFIRKCEYVISCCRIEGNSDQDLYVYHVITSKLTGKAASLISERQDLDTWNQLKLALEQHFGDPRSEECIAIEMETLKINNGESYLDFCNRIQHVKSTLIAKVNRINDISLRKSKIVIYDNMSMNVFLYNLPEDLLRVVRLKGCHSLENALGIVLEEVNFLYQYSTRNKMLRLPNNVHPRSQILAHNPSIERLGMKPFFAQNTQPQHSGFKFGIPQNSNNTKPNFYQSKFGVPSQQNKFTAQQPQQPLGYRPSFSQPPQQFGYRPAFNQTPQQIGYRPSFNQTPQQFGYRPSFNQTPQQFGYRPQLGYRPPQNVQNLQQQKPISTDVSMRTAAPIKPGFRLNELYNINEIETDDYRLNDILCDDTYYYNDDNTYITNNDDETCDPTLEQADTDINTQPIENFHISASNNNLQ